MKRILEEEDRYKRRKGGRPSVLSVLDKLVIMLQYYREYCTMNNISFNYETNKSIVYYAIKWTEKTLIKNRTFHLPSKKLFEDNSIEIIVVDVPEVDIERPQKTEKILFRKEKKTYIKKFGLLQMKRKKDILSIAFSGGNKHDFRLFKESRPVISETTFIIADKGYQGISDIHFNSLTCNRNRC